MTDATRGHWVILTAILSLLINMLTFVSLVFGGVLHLNSRLSKVETQLELLLQAHKMVSK